MNTRNDWMIWAPLAITILFLQAFVLHLNGRHWFCDCGTIRFWVSSINSSETSQQIADWYTFTHISHGFIFFGITSLLFKRWPVGMRLLVALGLEASWEILENTQATIDRYRQSALANGYNGDTILNSLSDTLAMTVGFFVARISPARVTVLIFILSELFLGYLIRDNLTLNVIQLIHPFAAISRWQLGG